MTVDELIDALMTAKAAGRGGTPVLIWASNVQEYRGWVTPDTVVGDEDRTIINLRPFL